MSSEFLWEKFSPTSRVCMRYPGCENSMHWWQADFIDGEWHVDRMNYKDPERSLGRVRDAAAIQTLVSIDHRRISRPYARRSGL